MKVKDVEVRVKVCQSFCKEYDNVVDIEYGKEYSVYLRNYSERKAVVKIHIDGKNVSQNGFVLMPFRNMTLERSIANGSMTQGNKFKFIQMTESIRQHRGETSHDGKIEVFVQMESDIAFYQRIQASMVLRRGSIRSMCFSSGDTVKGLGITVDGGLSNQTFKQAEDFDVAPDIMYGCFMLNGVSTKGNVCSSCGTKPEHADAKFCYACGTSLIKY